jgi:hypothetical protein
MMGFKRGDKVIVTGVTLYGSFEGCEGVIIRDSQPHDWLVDVTFPDGSHDELGFDSHELAAPAPQEPAPVSAAGDLLDTGDDAAALLNEAIKRVFDYASSTGKSRDKELAFIQQYIQAQAGQITGMIERMRDTEAKLAAATELAETNARLLANAQHELATVREWVKVCESNWHDNGAALAAILDERGVMELTISNRYIYKTMDGSAASFPVDTKGNRIAANALAADGEGDATIAPAKFAVGEWVEVRQPDGRPFADRMLVCRVFDDLGWRYELRDSENDPVPGTVAPESNLRKIEVDSASS